MNIIVKIETEPLETEDKNIPHGEEDEIIISHKVSHAYDPFKRNMIGLAWGSKMGYIDLDDLKSALNALLAEGES